ncbi:integral membrane protein [Arthrobacter sp. 2762]
MQPRTLFRTVAFAEAVTWTLLLIGLFLKYVTHTTEVGVSIAGGIHGFVFLCYAATAAFTWINQKWPARTGLLAIVSAVIPYATIPMEKSLDRRGLLAGGWRLAAGGEKPQGGLEKLQAWVLGNPILAVAIVLVGVAGVFSFLLFMGPPDTWFS